jgi:hypothetical protein
MSKYNYVITVKQPDYKNANAVSLLMLMLTLIVFIYTSWTHWPSRVYHNAAILYAVLSVFIAVWCIYCLALAPRLKRVPYFRLALAAAAIGWFVEPLSNYWMGALYALAVLIERQVKFPAEIGVDDGGITFNSLPAKSYPWQEIDNMLLKDDIITIEFKNNKIYQKETEADVSAALEKEFNAYCSAKLREAAIVAPVS